jgi:hypothetical protein
MNTTWNFLSPAAWRRAAVAASALVLAACGGGDVTRSLSGVAATGAPIAGGTVELACAGGDALQTTTSNAGTWNVTLTGQALPCKVRVSGGNLAAGTAYHSFAIGLGTVNITPLTDLVVARLGSVAPADWFGLRTSADFRAITLNTVSAALESVRSALSGVTGLAGLAGFNPVSGAFTAVTSDPFDQLLEALKAAFPNYAALLAAAQSPDFSAAAVQALLAGGGTAGGNGGGTGGDTGGGGAAGFACTDTDLMTQSNGAVRAATAEELAGYFRDYAGTFDYAGNNNYVNATATFSTDGKVTVKWAGGEQTYTGTSFCYDTTIGSVDYGNTLYVNFANGKVDLWKKNGQFAGYVKAPA